MYGVLQTLDELLEMSDAPLEGPQFGLVLARGRRSPACGRRLSDPPDLSDPRDQALALARTHDLLFRLGRAGRGG